ncbi:MAG TPA: TIGR03067 domain-containing protein [Gemmataceae bacterium]|nr:TIGR03067 domain-containing protein [Gemmataceae bacterium]
MSWAIAGCVVALTIGADPLNEAARKELKALEGEWVVQSIETKDAKHKPGDDDRMTLTVKGTKWTFGTLQEGEVIAVDPSTNPKVVDFKSVRKGREDTVNEAIYKVDKDTLVICIYQGKDKKRPTSFDKPTEADTVLWTLKKAKK